MRKDVQEIFKATPHEKQVMMFSATLSTEMRAVCKKFMQVEAALPPLRRPTDHLPTSPLPHPPFPPPHLHSNLTTRLPIDQYTPPNR